MAKAISDDQKPRTSIGSKLPPKATVSERKQADGETQRGRNMHSREIRSTNAQTNVMNSTRRSSNIMVNAVRDDRTQDAGAVDYVEDWAEPSATAPQDDRSWIDRT